MATACPGRLAQLDVYMSARIWLKLAEILVPVLLAITIFVSWQADRRDRAQLAVQLAAAQQTIAQATANQHDRDSALNQTLAQIATQKQAALTPAQLLKDLPAALSLPQPLAQQPSDHANVGARFIAPSTETTSTNPQQKGNTQPTTSPWTAKPAKPN
jgi:hypothetical protein